MKKEDKIYISYLDMKFDKKYFGCTKISLNPFDIINKPRY